MKMLTRITAAVTIAGWGAGAAEARQVTATYDGIAIAKTTGEALEKALIARGAKKTKERLYQNRTNPEPTGNAAADEALSKLYELMVKKDLLANGFERRLRKVIRPYGEAELTISTCPADDRISSVLVQYPKNANTRAEFAQTARELTAAIGRGPDKNIF